MLCWRRKKVLDKAKTYPITTRLCTFCLSIWNAARCMMHTCMLLQPLISSQAERLNHTSLWAFIHNLLDGLGESQFVHACPTFCQWKQQDRVKIPKDIQTGGKFSLLMIESSIEGSVQSPCVLMRASSNQPSPSKKWMQHAALPIAHLHP